jgi:hypothetical protein
VENRWDFVSGKSTCERMANNNFNQLDDERRRKSKIILGNYRGKFDLRTTNQNFGGKLNIKWDTE